MFRKLLIAAIAAVAFSGCQQEPVLHIDEKEVPAIWAGLNLDIAKNTPANSPTFASRGFGYAGVTMYESVVHGSARHHSLNGQLNGMPALPQPEPGKPYKWILALNAGQAQIIRSIYIQTSDVNKHKIDSLEKLIYNSFKTDTSDIDERSVAYGKAIANAIFEWSKTDGGHRGYLVNFDKNIKFPAKTGMWKPPFFAQTISRLPLHPKWGNNRTFLAADSNWKMPAFIPYDSAKASAYFKQFEQVYFLNKNLKQEQKEIALWWNDDPSDTYTPPGHSYNLARIVVKTKSPDMYDAAETFARTGLAVADAFIICWRIKYNFYSERPSTYVNEHIDDQWDPFWPDPPFPAFPSGHATQAGAVATVLSNKYGENIDFVDDTHIGRKRDEVKDVDYKARHFTSFWKVAEETAYSRYIGGIHNAQDNTIGLEEGKKVGEHINQLKWYN
ncbi:MAG: vanadium-dependent haloperoxidase [Chitinophagaceae bacterium]|nr:vanadium-dependent haloperoxidase [Chitinophagaceae bacterium]